MIMVSDIGKKREKSAEFYIHELHEINKEIK